jgi:nitrite reductase/ring-hydroxylating ferredoxin subunit
MMSKRINIKIITLRPTMTFITYIIDLIRRSLVSFSNQPCHVATYTRELPVSIERMYENAIDGEHLPHLHRDSFSELHIIESGDWGWKATGNLTPKSFMNKMTLELRLDRDKHRWITRTLSGLGKGSEIWTHAIPLEENKIKVIVDFYVPKLPKFLKAMYAQEYINTYSKLYDEDLWMMATRQHELDRLKNRKSASNQESLNPTSFNFGSLEQVEKTLPINFTLKGHPYRLIKLKDELIAHSSTCPHMLGPLQKSAILETSETNGAVECPWHGYQFDIKTRECITGQKCKLAPAPKIDIQFGEVSATF